MSPFWQVVVSNAVLATGLACGTALLGRVWRRPAMLHAIWLLVLVKLFTPPVISIGVPVAVANRGSNDTIAQSADESHSLRLDSVRGHKYADQSTGQPLSLRPRTIRWSLVAAYVWIAGSGVFATTLAYRLACFHRLLRHAEQVPRPLHDVAARIGTKLGVRHQPEIAWIPARIPPAVSVSVDTVRVILPKGLFQDLDADAQETILAHELAHVRRKDHYVRMLEVISTTIFWWHPVVWWARRELRDLEEECCDALVLEALPGRVREYATALVETLDFLSAPVRMPLGATGVRPAVSLARRIEMLKQNRPLQTVTIRTSCIVAAVLAGPMVAAFCVQSEVNESEKPPPVQAVDSEGFADKTYDVSDLVKDHQFDNLVETIKSVIQVETWNDVGGAGRISVDKDGRMKVKQSEKAHEQIASLLAALRKLPRTTKDGKQTVRAPIKVKQPEGIADLPIVVYHVPDILGTPPDYDSLIVRLKNVSRESWDDVGGRGSLEDFPPRAAFVIAQTPEVHAEIVRELQKLRDKAK